ncbi:hypothetical protein D3C78_1316260 [compost metagenome]
MLLDLAHFRSVSLAVLVGGRAIVGGQGEFLGAGQRGGDRIQRGFLHGQCTFGAVDVGLVLIEHRGLLAQLQQAPGTDRIIGGGIDALQAARLAGGGDGLVEVTLIVRRLRAVILGGGNAHELRLLKGC